MTLGIRLFLTFLHIVENLGNVSERNFRYKFERNCLKTVLNSIHMNKADFRSAVLVKKATCGPVVTLPPPPWLRGATAYAYYAHGDSMNTLR